jgi:hypothetical protein
MHEGVFYLPKLLTILDQTKGRLADLDK